MFIKITVDGNELIEKNKNAYNSIETLWEEIIQNNYIQEQTIADLELNGINEELKDIEIKELEKQIERLKNGGKNK